MPINETHPVMNTPISNISLWRYMDIPSFLSLISNNSITFVRADLFEDKFEGILPNPVNNALDLWAEEAIKQGQLSPEYAGFKFSKLFEESKKTVYINCWCKENHEMVHMWKIYSKENGIAIQTDYENLKQSVESLESVYPTEIRYLDYKEDIIDWQSNGLTAYTIKRKEYKSENEFRLIMSYPRIIEDQILAFKTHEEKKLARNKLYTEFPAMQCQVNVSKLIKKIHISPYAPKWYHGVIDNIVKKYNLNVEITQSEL